MKLSVHRSVWVVLCSVALGCHSLCLGASYLDIGDPAPVLKPAKWLKGEPIPKFEEGKVYVVEFWATWCGPCKENIPHLTELAKKHKGQVAVAGVSIWESNDPSDTGYLRKVEDFVRQQGDKMDYSVAVDGPQGEVAKSWMTPASENGIPASFVVGKDGKISWIGHPSKLEAVLDEVLAGKFDVAGARSHRLVEKEVERTLGEAMAAKDYKRAVEVIDKAVARRPELERAYAYQRLTALFHADPGVAIEEGKKILKESNGDIGAYRMLGSIIATQPDLSATAYAFGHDIIADALKQNKMGYLFLAMDADVLVNMGDKAGAAKAQAEAVAAAEKAPEAPANFVESMRKKLARLQAGL